MSLSRYIPLLFLVACRCNPIVQPPPVLPPASTSICYQACQICEPDEVTQCALACARDQAQGVAMQLNPSAVVEAGVCPNP